MKDSKQLILDYMSKNGLDQSQMAKKLAVNDSTLSRWLQLGTGMTRKNQAYIKHVCNELTHDDNNLSPEIKRIVETMNCWPPSLQARGLSAILEINEDYEREKNKGNVSDDSGERRNLLAG